MPATALPTTAATTNAAANHGAASEPNTQATHAASEGHPMPATAPSTTAKKKSWNEMTYEEREERAFDRELEERDHGERELAAYFTGKSDSRRGAEWRESVEAVLATMPAYHRGVMSMLHTTREWPDAVKAQFGELTSIAIRLDCCDHPIIGTAAAAEAASVARLLAGIGESDSPVDPYLLQRAQDHVDHTVRAYWKARRKLAKARAKEAKARARAERAAEKAARARLADAAE